MSKEKVIKGRGDEKEEMSMRQIKEKARGRGIGGSYKDRVLESRMPTKVISEGPSSLAFGHLQFTVP